MRLSRGLWALLLACFCLSGATGLVLEVVWVRMLTQVFGSTTLAISTVLGTFMAGLGLGAWLGGRIADKLTYHPLWAYAVCELGVAIGALLVPFFISGYPGVNAWLWNALGDWPLLLAMTRFVLCALLLIVPTMFMGATLPILSRAVVVSETEIDLLGRRVAALYAINTAGAVVGAFAAGFWLLPWLGTSALQFLAICAALAIAGGVAALANWLPAFNPSAAAKRGKPSVAADEAAGSTTNARLALIVFGLSGAVAMTLEVLLSRAMALVLGSAIQSFTLVLVLFLLGISLGAATMGRFASKSKDPLAWLAVALAGVAAMTLFALARLESLPELYYQLLKGSTAELDSATGIAIRAIVAGVIAPVTFFLGAIMPLAVRAYARSAKTVGADVGVTYTANTIGAVLGAVFGGFFVLPMLGLRGGLLACAGVATAAAALVALRGQTRNLKTGTLVAAGLLAVIGFTLRDANVASLSWGQYQHVSAAAYKPGGVEHELLYYRDGRSSTVTVIRSKGGVTSLLNNGKPDGSTYPEDTRMQILLGMLPALLHEGDSADALVIGYGTGMTVGALAQAPTVSHIDAVELEASVFDAADRHFGAFNNAVHLDPKVKRHVGDGRNFLSARGGKYDIIVSEPPNPWVAGVANLFSHEFYEMARSHMAPNGVFCQWVQLYYIRPGTVRRMYRTFHRTFSNVVVFRVNPFESILIGSQQQLSFNMQQVRERMKSAKARAELGRAGIRNPLVLYRLVALTPPEVARYVGEGPIYTDDNGRLEFDAQSDYFHAIRSKANRDELFAAWNREFVGYGNLRTLAPPRSLVRKQPRSKR